MNKKSNKESVLKKLVSIMLLSLLFLNLFSLMNDVYNASQWKCDHKELPILFIAGEKDPCIDTKEKWIEAQNFLKQLGYQSIQNHLYENMRHEILNEKEHEIVYKDILDFLESE